MSIVIIPSLVLQRELFTEGHQRFYARDWEKMVDTLEESLEHFYVALNECRTMCAGPMKYDTLLDFAQVGHVCTYVKVMSGGRRGGGVGVLKGEVRLE